MQEPNAVCEQVREGIDLMGRAQLHEARCDGPIHDHARQCPGCREYLRKALDLAGRLDQWDVPQPRRNIAAAVLAEVANSRQDHTGGPRVSLLRVHFRVPAVAAVAALLLLCASVVLNLAHLRQDSSAVARQESAAPVTPEPAVDRPAPAPVRVVSVDQQSSDLVRSLVTGPQAVPGTLVIILGMPPIPQEEPTVRPATIVQKPTL